MAITPFVSHSMVHRARIIVRDAAEFGGITTRTFILFSKYNRDMGVATGITSMRTEFMTI